MLKRIKSLPRITLVLGCVCIFLLGVLTAVAWQLYNWSGPEQSRVGGAVDFGLPTAIDGRNNQLFTAASAVLYDSERDQILFEQRGFDRRSIASITKLMAAMVALDHGIDWDKEMTIEPQEYVIGGTLVLHAGETLTMRDLFAASLTGSANNATLALVRGLGVSEREFVRAMNRKAIILGLEQTEFVEPTGLDNDNVSTAYEVARFANEAFTKYPEIAEFSSLSEYTFALRGSGREHTIRNTNKIISEWGDTLTGSKTGYTYKAGYCLVTRGTGDRDTRISVLLGSPSEIEHLTDTKRLLSLEL